MKVCIVCQKEVDGKKAVKVREDRIIKAIRRLKSIFRIAAGNDLYVCEEDLQKHLERRKSFEKSMLFFGILSVFVVMLLLFLVVMSGRFNLLVILSSFAIGAFILLFALVFKYAPGVENNVTSLVSAKAEPGQPKSRDLKSRSPELPVSSKKQKK